MANEETSEKKRFISQAEIDDIFTHHPPFDDRQATAHARVREFAREFASWLNESLPDGPGKTHLIRVKLPEVMMHANAIIAVHGLSEDYDENTFRFEV
jgi:hypothetical protein